MILRRNREDDEKGKLRDVSPVYVHRRHHLHRRHRKGCDFLYLPDQGFQRAKGERAFALGPPRHPGGPVADVEDCVGEGPIGTSICRKLSDELAPTVSGPSR